MRLRLLVMGVRGRGLLRRLLQLAEDRLDVNGVGAGLLLLLLRGVLLDAEAGAGVCRDGGLQDGLAVRSGVRGRGSSSRRLISALRRTTAHEVRGLERLEVAVLVEADIAQARRQVVQVEIDLSALLAAEVELDDGAHAADDQPADDVLLDVVRGVDDHHVAAEPAVRERVAHVADVARVHLLEEQELDVGRRRLAGLRARAGTALIACVRPATPPSSSVGAAAPVAVRVFAAAGARREGPVARRATLVASAAPVVRVIAMLSVKVATVAPVTVVVARPAIVPVVEPTAPAMSGVSTTHAPVGRFRTLVLALLLLLGA